MLTANRPIIAKLADAIPKNQKIITALLIYRVLKLWQSVDIFTLKFNVKFILLLWVVMKNLAIKMVLPINSLCVNFPDMTRFKINITDTG